MGRWAWTIGLLGLLTMSAARSWAVAEEAEVLVSASHLSLSLPQTGALSLLSRDGESDFEIDGDDAVLDRIDGRNHDLTGALVGSGDRPGVATDVDASDIEMSDVSVTGSSSVEEHVDPVDIEDFVNYLRANADLTLTSNTDYDGGTIGGPTDYQIVVVENSQLFLDGGFTGYGILLLYDTDPGNGQAQLRMTDQAAWYGTILCYSGDTPGDSDKIRLLFGDQQGGGSEPEAGDGVHVYGQVVAVGREIEVEFPNGAVADLFYSSAAVANVDTMLQSKPYDWERWRQVE